MTATKSTYRLLAEKIRTSNTLAQVERAEQSANRIYNAGLLSVHEYARLCDVALVTIGKLEN